MRTLSSSRWPAWILVAVLLGGAVAPWAPADRGACACGKTVGCCCALLAARAGHGAMPLGSSCSLRGGASRCAVKGSEGAIVRTRFEAPVAKLIARLGGSALRPPLQAAFCLADGRDFRPSASAPEPPTPPPRSS